MPSRRSWPRRLLLPTVLAAVLAAEITGLAIARSLTVRVAPATPADQAGTLSSTDDGRLDGPRVGGDEGTSWPAAAGSAVRRSAPTPANLQPPPPALAASVHSASTSTTSRVSAPTYRGRNHVWIPSLGITRAVQWFPCSRSTPPGAGVYRWGCAGRNNVYLMAHAWSAFRPLHDAYVSGRLHRGMKVWYGDGDGRVHEYSVIWWRVTAPTTAASWAWAAQSRPSMTLQTCVGANSQYRLMVRLVRVG
jgi:hypothetical protein